MKIKSISTEQFAGLQDTDLKFSDGMNVIIGENESGKSTVADLIYRSLFEQAKTGKRSDIYQYYFTKNANGRNADYADGTIVFETEEGTYRLKKEWDESGTCTLTLPDGTRIRNAEEIDSILKEALKYQDGVYKEIVFASQKMGHTAAESIVRELSKNNTRDGLLSTLTQTAMETGGVSIDKIEKQIQEKLEMLGFRWDISADLPEQGVKRGIQNPWSIKKGNEGILSAYYAMKTVEKNKNDAKEAELALESANTQLRRLKDDKEKAAKQHTEFLKYKGLLKNRLLLREAITNFNADYKKLDEVKRDWPKIEEEYKEVMEAKERLMLAENHSLYTSILRAETEFTECKNALSELKEVRNETVKKARILENNISDFRNQLNGLNLIAKIRTYGDTVAEYIPTSTGEAKTIEDGDINVKEAATIRVPGVIDIQLVPEGIDADAIKKALDKATEEYESILKPYDAQDVSELEQIYDTYDNANRRLILSEQNYKSAIKDLDWESIKSLEKEVPEDIEDPAVLKKLHTQKYGRRNMDQVLGGLSSVLQGYSSDYQSKEELQKRIDQVFADLEKKEKELNESDDVPTAFLQIKDSEEYDKKLADAVDRIKKEEDWTQNKVLEATRALGEKSAEEYEEELQQLKDVFEARKAEYMRWKHIQSVFIKVKEAAKGNPVEDIEKKFKEYLDVLTEGRLAVASIDDKISVKLTSGKHAMTYDILSEGTKDTIALAFRLAMLEHLFPEGNGMAVFDDPFTDMDPKRTKQACALIQKFAENNQVIFITCDDKYKEMLKGQYIPM